MGRTSSFIIIFAILLVSFCTTIPAQTHRQRITSTPDASQTTCSLTGLYRIDVAASDKLYSVVEGASSKVPFGEQQRFFIDLAVRLTPPDLLAIECRGTRVTVGSSRAAQITFVADGISRNARTADGNITRSRIKLEGNTLSFTSTGRAEDNLSVTFTSIEDGKRLRVTRRISAEQLNEPVVIQTVYNKIADVARWDIYGEPQIAKQVTKQNDPKTSPAATSASASSGVERDEADVLRNALNQWISATNARDIDKQMTFYMPELKAFYLARNASSKSVRAEKARVFAAAKSIDIRAEEPEIIFQEGGQMAVMRFRKKYRVENGSRNRTGEVIQELRWQQTNGGWKIFSERDVRVIR